MTLISIHFVVYPYYRLKENNIHPSIKTFDINIDTEMDEYKNLYERTEPNDIIYMATQLINKKLYDNDSKNGPGSLSFELILGVSNDQRLLEEFKSQFERIFPETLVTLLYEDPNPKLIN